jgi:formylglycine-generating enzyme
MATMKSTAKFILILGVMCFVIMGAVAEGGGASDAPFMELVPVEGGSFIMGSEAGNASERPVHEVQVDSFFIGKYEVTQAQWKDVMGSSPAFDREKGDRYPVYNVSWQDATAFCNKLSVREGLSPCYSGSGAGIACDFSANGYRLPTEAEWEFAAIGGAARGGAARSGKAGGRHLYAGSDDADEVGWDSANSGGAMHEVGTKAANEIGAYDMSGNLWEWCEDWYGADFYGSSPSKNPIGPESGIYRVQRGGSYGINAYGLRCSNRYYGAHRSDSSTGFRIARARQ